jgi:hypothetical protein
MPSSGMLRHVALVTTEPSENSIAFIIKVTRIGVFLGSVLQLLVNSNVLSSLPIPVTLMMEMIHFSETVGCYTSHIS